MDNNNQITKVLNQAVKRNINHFPDKFRFQLSEEEFQNWMSQNATPNDGYLRIQNDTLKIDTANLKSQYGKKFIIPILIPPNSGELKIKQG